MLKTECKIIMKDGSKRLVTEYEPLEPITLTMEDPQVKRMIEETVAQFQIHPDAEAPSIVLKTSTVIQ